MKQQAVGFQWLIQHFRLEDIHLTHRSFIGTRNKVELGLDGTIFETYGPKYVPTEDSGLAHLEFALKYDDLNLDLIYQLFTRMNADDIETYILKNLSGKYSRKTGFLYERLTGKILRIDKPVKGNYIDILDSSKYITGIIQKNARWRINDNLLGSADFCPIIRRNPVMEELLRIDFKKEVNELKNAYLPDIFNRVAQYLYRKETKSSYEIEQEVPSPDRVNRFVNLLIDAGKKPVDEVLDEAHFTLLQNSIVDPRYKQSGYRDFQNYIGQSNYRMEEIYHYICPPPGLVHSMMQGLANAEQKTRGLSPVVRAAIVAFGFVFIHPFLDGNGRIHRYLIHDILIRDGFVDKDVFISISAHLVNYLPEYNAALEAYSRPLMKRIQFTRGEKGKLIITNPAEVNTYYLYPDITAQTTFLAKAISETIRQDIADELYFLDRYDELIKEIQQVLDMPDKRINDMIIFIHQNKGIFPNRRKKYFPEITETEIHEIERIYQIIFS